jgi:hypothetical protein
MIKNIESHRLTVIDGNVLLEKSVKKFLETKKQLNLTKISARETTNFIYHIFIVDLLDLTKSLKYLYRSTIVFYTGEFKDQLLKGNILNFLTKKIKSTSPIPVFTMNLRNDIDLPHAAECCVDKCKSSLRNFKKHIYTNNLKNLKQMYNNKTVLIADDSLQ